MIQGGDFFGVCRFLAIRLFCSTLCLLQVQQLPLFHPFYSFGKHRDFGSDLLPASWPIGSDLIECFSSSPCNSLTLFSYISWGVSKDNSFLQSDFFIMFSMGLNLNVRVVSIFAQTSSVLEIFKLDSGGELSIFAKIGLRDTFFPSNDFTLDLTIR